MWIAGHLDCPSLYFEILTTMLHVSMSSRDTFSIVWTYNCDCLVKKCVCAFNFATYCQIALQNSFTDLHNHQQCMRISTALLPHRLLVPSFLQVFASWWIWSDISKCLFSFIWLLVKLSIFSCISSSADYGSISFVPFSSGVTIIKVCFRSSL